MGMSTYHYMGWFLLLNKKIDLAKYFPKEDFFRVFDEGGSPLLNDNFILIPNRRVRNCYNFDNFNRKDFTILPFEEGKIVFTLPPEIRDAMQILKEEKPEVHYGYFSYAN